MNVENLTVDIVLATHNGERYISEQLTSILKQTHKKINIIVTDDGSTDDTIKIVKDYISRDDRVFLFEKKSNEGVIANFNNGLTQTTSNYIMFSDQDDVWDLSKVSLMLNEIVKKEKKDGAIGACLVFSDLRVVDEDLKIISESFYDYNKLDPLNNLELRYLKWRSSVYGCSMIFNRELLIKAGLPSLLSAMHDHWFAFHAALYGNIYFLDKPLVNYRQHQSNVVGSHGRSIFQRVKRVNKTVIGVKKSVKSAQHLMEISDGVNLNIIEGRVKFICNNVFPFYKERFLYMVMFSFFWMINEK
ncbi:glycosyltransferase family 2 protein [Klebsiella michiganensis]|uniref:glycosyltransferase family 2 protein n=1 Tax=Klebsiella michiganensis TaxID=1134687 RepID=UPI0015E51132|nr:glycosyltransferase family 2 protein [Klebsiella michiganensis]QLP48988.1 glycosyltransferase family 2 protein [Klebsiella michiganensis]